jgi:iron complex transport system ATP-binding protein
LLRAVDVSFDYGGRGGAGGPPVDQRAPPSARAIPPVLNGVSADVGRGEILGILGPNGSGKTTLLRLLSGTRVPTAGDVLLDGTPLRRLSRRAVARRIAVVPQETHLAFDYTVMEMVLMGRHPHLGLFQIEGPADIDIGRDALHATGTADLEARQFNTLSGGEKQRVVIASALTQSSDILLLDEPTASLDLGYQLEVASLLRRLNRERGVTIAVSTHDLNFAASVCQRLVMLRAGRVIAVGTTADALTPGNVRALYGVTADVHVHSATGHLVVIPITASGTDASQ